MTNIVILAVSVMALYGFEYGASDEKTSWSPSASQSVVMTYTAPTNSVVKVYYTWTPNGPTPVQTGWNGMRWMALNSGGLTNGVYNGLGGYPTNYTSPRGWYTNTTITNTITFPVPTTDVQWYFRLISASSNMVSNFYPPLTSTNTPAAPTSVRIL